MPGYRLSSTIFQNLLEKKELNFLSHQFLLFKELNCSSADLEKQFSKISNFDLDILTQEIVKNSFFNGSR